mgnify:CR=1 FL=1
MLFKVGDIIELNVETFFHRKGLLAEVLALNDYSRINSNIKVKIIDDKAYGITNGRVVGADSKLFILHKEIEGVHV